MHSTRRALAGFLLLMATIPGLAHAMGKGRLIGKVLDPEGHPIEGVAVVVTSEQVKDFKAVETTDAKGVFKVDFDRLYVTYRLHFDKVGFQPLVSDKTWEFEGTTRLEFTMYPGEAVVVAGPVVSTSSEAVQAYNAGVLAYNSGDYATAAVRFDEALGHDPDLHPAWVGLSSLHLKQGQYQQAVEAAEKAIALGSTDETVYRSRWEAYRNLGDEAKIAAALADLETAGLRTEEAKRVYNEGVAFAKAGDHQSAFAKFQEALAVDPNLQQALLGAATTGLEIGRSAEAEAAAEKILKGDPHHEQALRIRFNAALQLGDDAKLVDALIGLAAVEPALARDGLLRLAYKAYDASDMALAKARFEKVLVVAPDQPQSHYVLALICVNDGATEEAKTYLRRFVELAPDDPEADTARDLLSYLSKP